MEPLGASTKQSVGSGGGSILSCCPCIPHGHERALKEEEKDICTNFPTFLFDQRHKDGHRTGIAVFNVMVQQALLLSNNNKLKQLMDLNKTRSKKIGFSTQIE